MVQDKILEILPYKSATHHMGKTTKLQKTSAQLVAEHSFCFTEQTNSTKFEVNEL